MISALSPDQAISSVSQSLFLSRDHQAQGLNDAVLAQALRRAVFILGPCASYELSQAVAQSFDGLGLEPLEFHARVDAILDGLIVYGDILEMRSAEDDDWAFNGAIVLRPSPPSFVARRSSSVVILGVAGDQITPLPETLESRILHRGPLRIIIPNEGEDLPILLHDLGLFKLSEKAWLRPPRQETPAAHMEFWKQQIAKISVNPSAIDGLRILDSATPPTFYRDRWCDPKHRHDGLFIARRPQRYGSDIWCLVELVRGVPSRFIDLNTAGDRLRPCDVAWRIQAAIDALGGAPQQYRLTLRDDSYSIIRFFSPLPSWAERHLSVAGNKIKAERSLFSYEVGKEDADGECRMLREMLWMVESGN